MIRLRTKLKKSYVLTVYFSDTWVTLFKVNFNSKSLIATSYAEAGQNHLQACQQVLYSESK